MSRSQVIVLNLLINAAVIIAIVIGIVWLYPLAGGHAFWLMLLMLFNASVEFKD